MTSTAGKGSTRDRHRRGIVSFVGAAALFFYAPILLAAPLDDAFEIDIVNTDIEDLLNMTITSVSKVPETLQNASAAVFVLTGEDIRRSGATSIPEALRMVPGVQVARVDANKWAVSIRGFNARAANKLLVMVDGRTIYNPLFSGVLWETRDVLLEDVDRIEVIRGPGGSTWGANAVNGVINIITKHARDTQGGLVTAGGGNEETGFSSARYGGKISDTTFFRMYGKYRERDEGYLEEGSLDDSAHGQGGFRFDGKIDDDSSFMIDGGVFSGDYDGPVLAGDVDGDGHHILGRWIESFSRDSDLTIQSFYDRTGLETPIFDEDRDTFEIDVFHQFSPYERFSFVYGAIYRYTSDKIQNTEIVALDPEERTDDLFSVFGETRISLLPHILEMQIGTKVEDNDYSGVEVQPDIGITWTVNERNTLWAGVSRAVRTPSRLENDFIITIPGGPVFLMGNRALDSETLIAYEAGYRVVPVDDIFIDVSGFFNVYDRLVTTEGITIGNEAHGNTYGAEVAATWDWRPEQQFKLAYSYLEMDLELDADSIANPLTTTENIEGSNPHHQVSLWSYLNLGERWQFDVGLRYVDALPAQDVSSYVVADARLAWKALENLELAVVGQNLFERRHFEQGGTAVSQVQQGVYGKVTWTF